MGRLRRPRKSGWLKKLRTVFAGNRVAYACDRRAKATRSRCICEDNSLTIATVLLSDTRINLSLSLIVTYRIIPVMQNMQTLQTKCNVIEVAAVGLYSSLKMRKHLSATGKVKMRLLCMLTQFSLCPAHSFFAQGLVIAKIDKIPLAQF